VQPTDAAGSPIWLEVAMILFIVIFLAIVAWVLLARPGAFKRASRIPLDDDSEGNHG
jgi:cbb3-type cytochrome oxidase subunit 3